MKQTTTIYALIDPRDGRVRYVGKTIQGVEKRLSQHKATAGRLGHQWCARWIKSLDDRGLSPEITTLFVVEGGDWAMWERFWIKWFRSIEPKLTNICDGGEGSSGKATQQVEVTCEECGKRVVKSKSNIKGSAHLYCGRKCANTGQKKHYKIASPRFMGMTTITCDCCNLQFEVTTASASRKDRTKRYCSAECKHKHHAPRRMFDDAALDRVERLIKDGLSGREIASRLGVSRSTISNWSRRIRQRRAV